MTNLPDLFQDISPLLVRSAGLLIILCALPLLALAWWKRIYPHTPLVVLLGIPCILSLALLLQPGLLPLIGIIDVAIPVVAIVDLLTLPRRRSFAVERETTRVVSVQKSHQVTLHVSNLSQRSIATWIRDDIPQEFEPSPAEFMLRLAPFSRATMHYELNAKRRGAFSLNQINLRVRSRLGLWQRLLAYPQVNELHVYPDMQQLSEYAILARTNRLSLMGVRRTRRVGMENDFERLRDYTLDDNYKFIDWRASARRQKLTVKDFQTSQSQRIIFLLDCGRLMTNESSGLSLLDHSLNAALMLSYVALRQGDSVGLIAFSDHVLRYVPPRGGMKQMNQLLHASFDRFPELVESRYDDAFKYLNTHCKKRSLVVLISNVIDEVNTHQIESYLRNLVGKHLPLGVILRDHRLFDAADREPANEEQLFEAAAASDILLWRRQVIRDLLHRGVLALDVFPEDMTAPLVNSYLEIKARHLL
jgi:uncharacterized protein (DUF58 family)